MHEVWGLDMENLGGSSQKVYLTSKSQQSFRTQRTWLCQGKGAWKYLGQSGGHTSTSCTHCSGLCLSGAFSSSGSGLNISEFFPSLLLDLTSRGVHTILLFICFCLVQFEISHSYVWFFTNATCPPPHYTVSYLGQGPCLFFLCWAPYSS